MGALKARAEDAQGDMVRSLLVSLFVALADARVRRREECDPTGKGALDLEGFIHGMWKIDEELRRAQLRSGLGLSPGRHPSSAGERAKASRAQPRLLLR